MTTLVDAIQHKFELLIDPGSAMQHVTLYGSPAWRKKFCTATGELRLPHVLVMDNSNVASLGDLNKLGSMCAHIVELDLANNRLTNWAELLKLLSILPQLRLLNLSINPHLGLVAEDEVYGQTDEEKNDDKSEKGIEKESEIKDPQHLIAPQMPNLSTLVLNQVPRVTWRMLAGLLSSAPNLVELYLCNNSLAAPDFACPKSGGYSTIQQLYFNGNRLMPNDWSRLAEWFPKLEKLTLIGNTATELPSNSAATDLPILSSLKSLNLSESGINSWTELEKLNSCPGLCDLRVMDIELAKSRSKKDFRAEAIARLPHVTTLNGTEVTDVERSAAERALIRAHTIDFEVSEAGKADRHSTPAQLDSLLAKHGQLDQLAKVDLRPTESVSMVLRYGTQSRTCQLATNQLVRDLKIKVCAQFSIDPAKVSMYYIDQGMVGAMGPDEMNLPGRAFHSYRPEDGDELVLRDRK